MKPDYRKIHSRFKLNGIAYSRDDLKEVACSLVKEGEPFEKALGAFLLDWLDDRPTCKVQTSGSTGRPKPIRLQKQYMVNSALATGDFFGLRPGDSALLCLPTDYIAGKMMLVRAMALGLELDYVPPASDPLADVSKAYDFCAMVPLQLENSLDALGQVKILIVGGTPLSANLKVQVRAQAGPQSWKLQRQSPKTESAIPSRNRLFATAVFETYGMTETITHVAVKRVDSSNFLEVEDAKLGTTKDVGPSLRRQQIGVAEDGEAETSKDFRASLPRRLTETGKDGEIGNPFRPENKFIALPDITFSTDDRGCLIIEAPKIADAPVVTNDMVNLVSKTEFEWLGRYDNVINSGGIKLFPEQIEAKLSPMISSRFFIAGISDKKLGQKLVLVVEGEINKASLFQEIKSIRGLQKFEVPKEIYQIPEFYETDTGKIQRKKTLTSVDE